MFTAQSLYRTLAIGGGFDAFEGVVGVGGFGVGSGDDNLIFHFGRQLLS